jgi:predicted porin
MGGLYGQAMVSLGEGQNGNKIYAGRIGWAAGPINVAAAYGITEASASQDLTNWNLAGSWQVGPVKLSGFYSSIELDSSATFSEPLTQTNWYLGAAWAIGATTIKGTYGSVERDSNAGLCYNAAGAGSTAVTTCDATQWAIGATYDLSKRTALYATYSSIDNSGTIFRTFGSTNALSGLNDTNTGYQFGVRHSF